MRVPPIVVILSVIVCMPFRAGIAIFAEEGVDFFERKIRPVLIEHCYSCHSSEGKQIEGGLRLDSREAMRRGGESGPAVKPSDLDASLLLSALKHESFEMPPDRRLSNDVIADFEKWILQGAVDPRDEVELVAESVRASIDYEEGRKFWSFQRPVQLAVPPDPFAPWARSRIDHFVSAKMHEQGLTPNVEANSATIVRRLAFDLTGLPPSEKQYLNRQLVETERGLSDLVEQLLASKAFGEHFARMWLDVMRFADDQAHLVGNDKSLCYPNSYMYRDWVIDALNNDMPYDRFVELQLAADLLTPDDLTDDVALGFIGLGPKYYRRGAPEVMADELEDRVDVLSRGLLGLTVACARCHDHKYDPIAAADYYALAGVFNSTEMYNRPLPPESGDDADDSQEQKEAKEKKSKDPSDSLHIVRDVAPKDLNIMIRGDASRKGPLVPRGFLTVFAEKEREVFQDGSGRLELARQITSMQNPLTARVIVNRVWARLLGRALVGTQSNFGSLGDRPTHPELLDDLSARFMKNGWSLKWLCREIVTSATYRQSSLVRSVVDVDVDVENVWLSRANRKRLNVEQWRDSILMATGRLDETLGGQSVDPSDPGVTRRTIYSHASRLKLNPMLALFDYPDPNNHSSKRSQTTTASQKLFLLNSPFMIENAKQLATQAMREGGAVREVIERVYQRLFSREPSLEELDAAVRFLEIDASNLDQLVHALMVTNEMFFVD